MCVCVRARLYRAFDCIKAQHKTEKAKSLLLYSKWNSGGSSCVCVCVRRADDGCDDLITHFAVPDCHSHSSPFIVVIAACKNPN